MTKITHCFDTVGGFYRFLTQYLTAHRDESEYVHVFFGLFVCFPKFFLNLYFLLTNVEMLPVFVWEAPLLALLPPSDRLEGIVNKHRVRITRKSHESATNRCQTRVTLH